jgi:hypothetical protein
MGLLLLWFSRGRVMPHRNRVIVIDDKTEDGEAIVKSLWRLQIPSFFLHYDQVVIEELDANKKFEGIRYIFQDIALVSPDFPGTDDYSAAAAGIDRILGEENGPWLLIAWSTWGCDPDQGGKYAKELFEYLVKQLSSGKRPYQYVVIDKRPYSSDGQHAAVKASLDSCERDQLITSVKEAVMPVKSLEALGQWESDIRSSASKVLYNLWNMIEIGPLEQTEKALGGLLLQLAIAQEGIRLEKSDNLAAPLYQILSGLLYDKISHIKPDEIRVNEDVKQSIKANIINTMLHWEKVCDSTKYSPGYVYQWPKEEVVNLGCLCISKSNIKEFVLDAFVADNANKQKEARNDMNFMKNVELVLLDITPACDHANNKAFWRRFLVGVKVTEQARKHFYTGGSKLAGDYVKDTPQFIDNVSSWQLIFNSKLIVSLADKKEYISDRPVERVDSATEYVPDVTRLTSVGRVREQLLQEFIAWFGGMATRPGVVSLR